MDLGTGDRFHTWHYEPAAAGQILAAFRAAGLEPCVYVDHAEVDVFVGDRPSTHPDHLAAFGTTARAGDLEEVVQTVPVLMFGIMGHAPEPLFDVSQALAETAEAHVAGPDQYGGHSCTATPAGLSKWIGVLAFCARAGLDPDAGPRDRRRAQRPRAARGRGRIGRARRRPSRRRPRRAARRRITACRRLGRDPRSGVTLSPSR